MNFKGCLRVTHAVLPGMTGRGFGRIVNLSSDAACVGSSLESVYAGAKGGVISFTKTIAREVARSGVTANTVCPGPTDTPLLAGIVEAADHDGLTERRATERPAVRAIGGSPGLTVIVAAMAVPVLADAEVELVRPDAQLTLPLLDELERNLNRWTIAFTLVFVANIIVLLKI